MTSGPLKTEEIRKLLKDIKVKLLLESPKQDYQLEYYTTTIKDPNTDEIIRYIRTYRLNDLIRGNVTQEPWDTFDLDKQTGLVANLLTISEYRVVKAINGWTVKCPKCNFIMEGEIWKIPPKACLGSKCRHKIKADEIVENLIIGEEH